MRFLIPILFLSSLFEFFQITSAFNHGLTSWDLLSLVFYAIFAKKAIWDGEKIILPKSYFLIALSIFVFTILLSAVGPFIRGESDLVLQFFKSFAHFIFTALIGVVLFLSDVKTKDLINGLKSILIISIPTNMFAIYQLFARLYDLPFAFLVSNNVNFASRINDQEIDGVLQANIGFEDFVRATSFFSEPSTLAFFNIVIIILIAVPVLHQTSNYFRSKLFNLIILIFALIGLFLTYSMAGVAMLGAFGFLTLIRKPIQTLKTGIVSIVIGVIVLLPADKYIEDNFKVSVVNTFGKRISTIISGDEKRTVDGESYVGRVDNISDMIKIWKKYPLNGIGFGLTFSDEDTAFTFSDTSFFAVLAELGVIGLLAFLFFLFSFYRDIISNLLISEKENDKSSERLLLNTAFYLLAPVTVTNLFTANLITSVGLWYYVVIFMVAYKNSSLFYKQPTYELKPFGAGLKSLFYLDSQFQTKVK